MKKYAVIDIGSNTVRMVIYTAEDAAFHGLFSKKYTLGLAGYIQDGIMTQEASISCAPLCWNAGRCWSSLRLNGILYLPPHPCGTFRTPVRQ